MNNENRNKREPWRIVVGIIAIVYILFMWVKKDIVSIYATMPQEEVIPLIVTTVVVSLVKVAVITVGIMLIKWGIRKVQKKVF
ncbi:MAG: hypothetical protein E7292_09165 [Lachnospiraceae bacterium]|nr:hypothetical protein [Lachnospiraceae bacterium]